MQMLRVSLMLRCCFTSTETVDLLRTGAQEGHLDFHTAPELCRVSLPSRHFVSQVYVFRFLPEFLYHRSTGIIIIHLLLN